MTARKAADYTRRRKPVPCTQSWPLSAWKSVQESGRTGRFLLSVPQVGRRPIQSRFHRRAFLLGALGPAIAPALASLYACHPRPVNTYHPFCHWCQCPLDADSATADHLVPRSRGGSNSRANLCLACHACNQKRRNRLPGDPWRGIRMTNKESLSGEQPANVSVANSLNASRHAIPIRKMRLKSHKHKNVLFFGNNFEV